MQICPSLQAMMKQLDRLASFLLRFIALFLGLNLLLAGVFAIRDYSFPSNPIYRTYGKTTTLKAYPDQKEEVVSDILHHSWGRPYRYDPFTAFKEAPYQSDFVNVDSLGFRHVPQQGAFPLDTNYYNIFLFGGSTLFGYGLSDAQTIPAHIQDSLGDSVRVYNFASGFHYSVQEMNGMVDLFSQGHLPNMVIFVDGLNEFYFEHPEFSPEMSALFLGEPSALLARLWQKLPWDRLMKAMRVFFRGVATQSHPIPDAQYWENCLLRYTRSIQMSEQIAATFDIPAIFVWQPISVYRYDAHAHLFADLADQEKFPSKGYFLFDKRYGQEKPTKHYLNLSGIQENCNENLYVDRVHYGAKLSRTLADRITQEIRTITRVSVDSAVSRPGLVDHPE